MKIFTPSTTPDVTAFVDPTFPPHPRSIDGRQVAGDTNPPILPTTVKHDAKVPIKTDRKPPKCPTTDLNAAKVPIKGNKHSQAAGVKSKVKKQPTIAAMMSLCRRNGQPFTCIKCGYHNENPRGPWVHFVHAFVLSK